MADHPDNPYGLSGWLAWLLVVAVFCFALGLVWAAYQ